MLIGVISDTHSFLHERVPELMQGVEHILHAGDIGDDAVIQALRQIAPVTVVRGNVDREPPASEYPLEETLVLGGCRIFLTHQIKQPKSSQDPALQVYREAGVDVVVFGHSHIAYNRQWDNLLFFNPGAAGKRRFKVVPSIGFLNFDQSGVQGTIVPL